MKLRQIAALVALVVGPALCARAVDAPSGCITFSASEPFGIRLKTDAKDPSKLPTVSLSWSANGQDWSTVADNADYAAALDGGTYKIHFRGTGNSALSDLSAYRSFTNTVDSVATKIACSGNVETLLDYQTVLNGGHPEMGEYAFARLFMGFEALTTAPELPATELNDMCYWFMFVKCTSLTNAPALPATKAAYWGYHGMFASCTALTQAPELPATQLSVCCYAYMFSGCTALKKAPKLIATELKSGCYDDMFAGCTALAQAPELPATKLVEDCYRGMFYGCTALTALPEIPATSLERGCCDEMFYGCTALEVNKDGPGKEWKIPATSTSALEWGPGMFDGTSGDVQGQPALNTTYYIKSALLPGSKDNPWLIGAGEGDTVEAWTNETTLVVQGAGKMKDFDAEDSVVPWPVEQIAAVNISGDVTAIGQNAWLGLADGVKYNGLSSSAAKTMSNGFGGTTQYARTAFREFLVDGGSINATVALETAKSLTNEWVEVELKTSDVSVENGRIVIRHESAPQSQGFYLLQPKE